VALNNSFSKVKKITVSQHSTRLTAQHKTDSTAQDLTAQHEQNHS